MAGRREVSRGSLHLGPKKLCGRSWAALVALSPLWPLSVAGAAALVGSAQPGNVFQASQPLVFTVAASVARPYRWRVTDWNDRRWAQGTVTGSSAQLSLPRLPLGYYELQLEPAQSGKWDPPLPFARVVDVSSRAPSAASPYDVNGIQSKLVVPASWAADCSLRTPSSFAPRWSGLPAFPCCAMASRGPSKPIPSRAAIDGHVPSTLPACSPVAISKSLPF